VQPARAAAAADPASDLVVAVEAARGRAQHAEVKHEHAEEPFGLLALATLLLGLALGLLALASLLLQSGFGVA